MLTSQTRQHAMEMLEACKREQFPACLGNAVRKVFGEGGAKSLDSIVMNEIFGRIPVSSMNDAWKIYERYLERATNILGKNAAQVIELETIKEMERTECPLLGRALKKLKMPSRRSELLHPRISNR